MSNFFKKLFSSPPKTFPDKSSKTAMLYLVARGVNQADELQMLAMVAGAPIFFTYINGNSVGRFGLQKVEFPPTDFVEVLMLENIAKYIKAMGQQGIKFELESDGLCEYDYNELVKCLRESEN